MWSSVQATLNVSGPLAQFGRPNLSAAHKLHIYCFLIGYSTAGARHNVCITLTASESFPTKKNNNKKKHQPQRPTSSAQTEQVWESILILWCPAVNSYISTSSTEQRDIFSRAWVVPRVRAVPGLECPEVNKNKLWQRIKGSDIVLLGKQRLIAIMICRSAAGRQAEPHSEVEAQLQPRTCPRPRADWWFDPGM